MPNLYIVTFSYSITTLNGSAVNYGPYSGLLGYISENGDGSFPDANNGQLINAIYLSPCFYPPGGTGRMSALDFNSTLVVQGGQVSQFGGNSTFGSVDANINASSINFANNGVNPQITGSGPVVMNPTVAVYTLPPAAPSNPRISIQP